MSDRVNPDRTPVASEEEVALRIRRKTRRSFLVGGLSALAGLAGWRWMATRSAEGDIPWPLRRVLQFNERLARGYFRESHVAPTFSRSLAREPRVNGTEGMEGGGFDPVSWRLRVEGPAGAHLLTLEEIRALPRVELVTELKCIEGWSVAVQWAGARFADFAAKYAPVIRGDNPANVRSRPQDHPGYVGLATPDSKYYVGMDMASALHPQTLLCYEMNGAPLTVLHGAPLRLVSPVKYGIKNIKRIGTIRFTDTRPADYWAERGYDWYAGL